MTPAAVALLEALSILRDAHRRLDLMARGGPFALGPLREDMARAIARVLDALQSLGAMDAT